MNNIALHGLSKSFQNWYFVCKNKDINVEQISIEYTSLWNCSSVMQECLHDSFKLLHILIAYFHCWMLNNDTEAEAFFVCIDPIRDYLGCFHFLVAIHTVSSWKCSSAVDWCLLCLLFIQLNMSGKKEYPLRNCSISLASDHVYGLLFRL